jgi:hypothetical protein
MPESVLLKCVLLTLVPFTLYLEITYCLNLYFILFMRFLQRFLLAIAAVLASTVAFSQNYVEVGTGTVQNTMPIYSYWNYSWSSLIYNHVDLGSAKTITKIGLNCINGPKTVTNQKLYVKLTTNEIFASAAYEDPTNNGYTLVFDGNLTFQTGWNEIVLTTPIVYDGTKNLIIHWENRWGTSYGPIFNSTASTINNNKNCGNDVTFPGVGSTGYLNPYPSSLANMRFYYTGTGPATPYNPIPADNAHRVSVGTTLSWTLGANTTSYDLYFGTSLLNMALVVSNAPATAGTNTYTPPALLQDSLMHYWKVVAKNGSQLESSPVWKFKTEVVIDQFPYNQGFEDSTVFNTYPVESAWTIVPDVMWYESDMAPHTGSLSAKSLFFNSYMYAILQSPKVLLPSNHQISYYWKNSISKVAGHDTTFFEITTNGGQTWTTLDVLSPVNPSPVYVQRTFNLNAYAGNNFFFRFRYKTDNSGSANAVYVDDISIVSTAPTAGIQLSANQLAFRELYVNGHTTDKIAVTNSGTANLVISSVSVAAPFACTFSGTLVPGQSDTLTVTFNGNAAGSFNNTLTLNIQGAYSGTNTLPVTGIVLGDMMALTEPFDATIQIPAHWNKIKSTWEVTNDVTIVNSPPDAHSVPNTARLFNANDSLSALTFITPGLTTFDANVLTFYAKKSAGTPALSLIVGVMDDPYDAGSFVPVQTITLTNTQTQYSVTFNASNIKPYIAFRHGNNRKNATIWMDDVVWDNPVPNNPPAPAMALYPAISAVNVDILMQAKYLIWADGGGNPEGYRLSLGTNNPPTNMLNSVNLGDTVVYQIANTLGYTTTYYWQIVPYNSNGPAVNCPVWSFTTMSDPTINAFPFVQNYDALIPGSAFYYPPFMMGYVYPLGWSVLSPDNKATSWTVIENSAGSPGNAHSAPNAMNMGSSPATMDEWLFSPPLVLSTGYSYDLSFFYKSAQGGTPTTEKLEVMVGTSSTPGAMSLQVYDNPAVTNTEYAEAQALFIPDASGVYYFGFHGYSNANQNRLFVDDVTISKNLITGQTNFKNDLQLVVYPNPNNGMMYIRVPDATNTLLEITDMAGKLVHTQLIGQEVTSVELPAKCKGVYTAKLITNQKIYTSKFVVN